MNTAPVTQLPTPRLTPGPRAYLHHLSSGLHEHHPAWDEFHPDQWLLAVGQHEVAVDAGTWGQAEVGIGGGRTDFTAPSWSR